MTMTDAEHNRRYGRRHRRTRATVEQQVNAGGVNCCRCGEPIEPFTQFHLDHDDDGPGYRGVAHPHCNISANQGGWRARRERLPTDDELYCGFDNAPVGTISTNGRMIKVSPGGWSRYWRDEDNVPDQWKHRHSKIF